MEQNKRKLVTVRKISALTVIPGADLQKIYL